MAPIVGWGSVSCQRLTENIIVLGILTNQQAGQPSENKIPRESTPRQLRIERERDLVDIFAFLSATRDDPKRVMAVCLEEHVQKKAMTIRVAANTGDLLDVKDGLKQIARTLERISKRSLSTSEGRDLLLQQIVSMDEARILSRLCINHKFSHWLKQGKVFPFSRLRDVLSRSQNASSPSNPSPSLENASKCLNEIELLHADISDRLGADGAKNQMHEYMLKLLKLCDSLIAHVDNTPNLPQTIPPQERTALEKLRKIGRYRTISYDLAVAARDRRYEVFDHIKVEVIKIRPSWSAKPKSPASLTVCLENACGPARSQTTKDMVASYIQSPDGKDTHERKQEELNQGLSTVPKSWKVHAEIQLLLHYELHPKLQKPRVICSNKDACYLCNLFIKAHSLYHIPRTHGKLYDTWCFPDLTAELESRIKMNSKQLRKLENVVERFNSFLEKRIKLILSGAKFFYQLGNVESTLLPYNAWSASALSHGGSVPITTAALKAIAPSDKAGKTALLLKDVKTDAERSDGSIKALAGQEWQTGVPERSQMKRTQDGEATKTPGIDHGSQAKIDVEGNSQPIELIKVEDLATPPQAAIGPRVDPQDAIDQRATSEPLVFCPGSEGHSRAEQSLPRQHSRIVLDEPLAEPPKSIPTVPSTFADYSVLRRSGSRPRDEMPSTPLTNTNKPVNADITRTYPLVNVDAYALEHPKDSRWLALSTPGSSLTFSSPNLKLDLSQVWTAHSSRTTWVRASLIPPEDVGGIKGDVINARALSYNEEITVARGSALSGDALHISAGSDVVAVQYSYELPPAP